VTVYTSTAHRCVACLLATKCSRRAHERQAKTRTARTVIGYIPASLALLKYSHNSLLGIRYIRHRYAHAHSRGEPTAQTYTAPYVILTLYGKVLHTRVHLHVQLRAHVHVHHTLAHANAKKLVHLCELMCVNRQNLKLATCFEDITHVQLHHQ
jgi:hypothetical protein